eukprot:TRINITY_DN8674_c0_g1_i12.p1 TRINITY_DN8674_c0_g1~~TRINITY_DN8674_c0_g1_i12.p1  ORF type:complete len:258 (+),score=75.45 TRINITY_DN8674_c0_g1_i12:180-953(+)
MIPVLSNCPELIAWINNLLKVNIVKIEQTYSGAVACQIVDAISPGVVPLQKVSWDPRQEHECVANYKILQQAFFKLRVGRKVNVEKLVGGDYGENLEFLQWLKQYYETHANLAVSYNAIERRENALRVAENSKRQSTMTLKDVMPSAKKTLMSKENRMNGNGAIEYKAEAYIKEINSLRAANIELQKERDFYLSKLRDLEMVLQLHEKEKVPLADWMRKVLYGTPGHQPNLSAGQVLCPPNVPFRETGRDPIEAMQE